MGTLLVRTATAEAIPYSSDTETSSESYCLRFSVGARLARRKTMSYETMRLGQLRSNRFGLDMRVSVHLGKCLYEGLLEISDMMCNRAKRNVPRQV